jgi:hypothetical protein
MVLHRVLHRVHDNTMYGIVPATAGTVQDDSSVQYTNGASVPKYLCNVGTRKRKTILPICI